jgi:outer membrane protein assembly factor BamA
MRWWWVAILCALALPARADQLSATDLAKKNDGGYFTGLPLVAYSTDLGFGGGARVYYYWDGHRDDPRFSSTPYLFRMFLQAFASTNGLQFHWLDFDAPKIADTPYRFRAQLIYERNINQNYFGLGSRSLAPLAFPGSAKTYGSYADYSTDQSRVDPNGLSWEKYDQYDLQRPFMIASMERLFAGDRIRVLGGFGISYTTIRDYSGKSVDAVDATGKATTAPEGQTRLAADCAAGLVVGCKGGRENYLRFGISYDTRDFEPDPNSGVFLDAAVDAGTIVLGSEYSYIRAMAAARGYWSPIPDRADLVLAGRAVFEAQTSGTPFFSMDTFPFTEDPRTGLGGHRTLRGFRQDRFVGPVYTLLNLETRWTWGHATVWRQKLAFIAVPFVDVGRPYDHIGDLTVHDWRASYGGAFRVSWNLATVITVDYGRSSEDTGFYVNFNHIF